MVTRSDDSRIASPERNRGTLYWSATPTATGRACAGQFYERRRVVTISRPWMSDEEIGAITKRLNKTQVMLEWGSGGSTIFLSPLVARYYSIEHDPEWHAVVAQEVESRQLTNVTLRVV